MSLKYDFNITQGNNIVMDALIYANNQTSHFLVYGMVLIIFIVTLWVINIYTDDAQLSLVYSNFIVIIIGILFYYGGLYVNAILFSGNLLVALIFIEILLVSLLYYSRNGLGGD